MRPYSTSVLGASLCSLLLGIIATGVVTLIGPCLQILAESNRYAMHSLNELLGHRLGSLLSQALGVSQLRNGDLLIYIPLGLISLAAAKAFFYVLQSFLWERLGELMSKDIRFALMRFFVYLAPTKRKIIDSAQQESDLSSTLSTDIRLLREYLVHFYGGMPRELLQVFFMGITLFLLSAKLFFIFFLGVIPAAAIVARLGKKLRRRAGLALADYSSLTEWLQQRLLGVETIKHYQSEAVEKAKFHALTGELFDKFLRAERVKARTSPLVELVSVIALVVVLLIALSDIEQGKLTGSIAISFFATLAMMSQSAAKVARYFNSNREGAAAVDRIHQMFVFGQAHSENQLKLPLKSESSDIVLRCAKLWVRYPDSREAALRDFTYSFKRGRIYAIAGPSGSGKSTLFNTILGLQAPEQGELAFNRELAESGGPIIGYMPQQVQLMSGSLAENIAYPLKDYDGLQVEQAAAQVGLQAFLSTLPAGLATRVGQDGLSLSGGQAQRLLLARLCYHRYPLVLIDEGTSALDPEMEQHIFRQLLELKKGGSTVLMIAHRRSALQLADETLVLQQGRLR